MRPLDNLSQKVYKTHIYQTFLLIIICQGYYMTEVGDFALSTCDGRALPSFCSGLAIVSRFPFIEVRYLTCRLTLSLMFSFIQKEFLEFSYHGSIWNPDGEYWARKVRLDFGIIREVSDIYNLIFQGAGRARVEPHPGFIVDLLVTHTCAVGPTYTNAYYREHQVWCQTYVISTKFE